MIAVSGEDKTSNEGEDGDRLGEIQGTGRADLPCGPADHLWRARRMHLQMRSADSAQRIHMVKDGQAIRTLLTSFNYHLLTRSSTTTS